MEPQQPIETAAPTAAPSPVVGVEAVTPGQPVTAAGPTTLAPVSAAERIVLIDVLRGFALLGILVVNMGFYTIPLAAHRMDPPYWPDWPDRLAQGFIEIFAEGKFFILFSFLFGHGIAIQLLRAEARGQRLAWTHLRRMLILLAIGLVHAFFIWMGDILIPYALTGLVLLFFLRRRPQTVLIWAGIVYFLPCLVALVIAGVYGLAIHQDLPAQRLEEQAQARRIGKLEAAAVAQRTYAKGSLTDVMTIRAREVVMIFPKVVLLMFTFILAMFLFGLWAGRQEIFGHLPEYLGYFRAWRWPALAIGLAGNILKFIGMEVLQHQFDLFWSVISILGFFIANPCLSFFYVSTLTLASTSPRWQGPLRLLAPVGQMALTNYLAQSVLCTTIFYSHGLGLYAQVPPSWGLALTAGIFLVEVVWSNVWLRGLGFRYGPMEWLWRSLTYGKLQPMR